MLMKIAPPDIVSKLSRAWFWTLEICSLAVVALCWMSTFVPAAFPWNPRWVFSFLFDFSSGVVALLLVTACLLWRRHRNLAIGGLLLCLMWLMWAKLPDLATHGSGM